MLKSVLIALSLLAGFIAQAGTQCPTIQLQGPQFLGGSEYPSYDQLRSNFNQTFTLPGNPNYKTWDESDLQTAHAFVTVLKRHMVNHGVTLASHAGDQVCEGSLETLKYQVDENGVVFDLGYRNSITIQKGAHQAVNFMLSLPSNCSGCSRPTELFEFSKVSSN